ncbi:MAG: HAMP domain-containing sensor histidine kinase [Actinomycetota bacterium]
MTRRILLGYMVVTFVALLVVEIPLGIAAAQLERDRFSTNTEKAAEAIAATFATNVEDDLPPFVARRTAQTQVVRTGGRVVIVDPGLLIVADTSPGTELTPESMNAIESALIGEVTTQTRRDADGREMVFSTVPATTVDGTVGVIELSEPVGQLNDRIRRVWLILAALGVLVLGISAIVGWGIARSVSRPIRRLQEATGRLADGDLHARVDIGAAPSDLREFALVLQDTTDRLHTTLERQRSFLADASHQLRTPLTALRLRLENVEPSVDPDARSDIEAAIDETERLTELVGQLLRLAKAEEEATEPVAVDLTEIARERRDIWEALAEEQGVELRLDDSEGSVAANAVPGAVEQILDNYLSNALAVSPVGSTIQLSTGRSERGYQELHVIDEGPGLDDESLERAFDRFWRGDPSTPGTGIGLPIVAMLARASGGRAELRRAESGGVDAVCVLPAASRPVPTRRTPVSV